MAPLIVDTDPGVDDALAIVLACASPEVDLRAVTTVFGNAPLAVTTANAGRVLALAGRPDVPVGAGAARPLSGAPAVRDGGPHGADGLGGRAAALPGGPPPDPRGALALAADVLRDSAEPVTIAAIGPLTNVALLLDRHAGAADRIARIVWMGGAFDVPGRPVEFNARCDPEAAHRVLAQADVPVTVVPLDLTLRCTAGPGWRSGLAAAGRAGAELARMLTGHGAAGPAHDTAAAPAHDTVAAPTRTSGAAPTRASGAVPVHDAVAVLEAVAPGTLTTTATPIAVTRDEGPTRGATARTGDGRPVAVALGADPDAVLAEVLARLHRACGEDGPHGGSGGHREARPR